MTVTEPRCKVCTHPRRPEIEAQLRAAGGESTRAIARDFSGVERNSLARHFERHMRPDVDPIGTLANIPDPTVAAGDAPSQAAAIPPADPASPVEQFAVIGAVTCMIGPSLCTFTDGQVVDWWTAQQLGPGKTRPATAVDVQADQKNDRYQLGQRTMNLISPAPPPPAPPVPEPIRVPTIVEAAEILRRNPGANASAIDALRVAQRHAREAAGSSADTVDRMYWAFQRAAQQAGTPPGVHVAILLAINQFHDVCRNPQGFRLEHESARLRSANPDAAAVPAFNVHRYVATLMARGVRVSLGGDGDSLAIGSPTLLNSTDRNLLRVYKREIIAALQNEEVI